MEQKPFLMESGANWLAAKAREYKIPLLASFLFGLLAYGFTLTNKLVNHDEVASLFERGSTLALGRWGLDILERIFPSYSMPWLYGITTIALIAVSVCVIVHIFHIRSRLMQVLLAGSIIVFPSLTSTLAYMFTSSSYAIAFLSAVIAVALMKTPKRLSAFFALGFLVFSLSIYQAYISLAAGLLVVILMQELLEGTDVKKVLQKGVGYVVFLAVSLIAYYAATQLLLRVLGRSFIAYAQDSMRLSLADIPGKIVTAYGSFFRFFTQGYQGLIPTGASRVLHFLLLAASALFFLLWGLSRREKDWGRYLLLAALAIILPLALNCMYLFTTEEAVHTLVLYGFVVVYVLAVVLAEANLSLVPGKLLRQIGLESAAIAMALIVATNIYIANMISLNLHLRYENAYAFYTALASDIQQMPEFNENTKLAVVGNYRSPAHFERFTEANTLTGTTGFLPSDYSKERFVQYYVGIPLPFATDEEVQAIEESAEFAEMPVYPYYGSMKFIGDTLVVKLS